MNVKSVKEVVENHESLFNKRIYLIINVRNNGVGNAKAYFPLLSYIFTKGEGPSSQEKIREIICIPMDYDNINLIGNIRGECS